MPRTASLRSTRGTAADWRGSWRGTGAGIVGIAQGFNCEELRELRGYARSERWHTRTVRRAQAMPLPDPAMPVPLFDTAAPLAPLREEIDAAIARVIESAT